MYTCGKLLEASCSPSPSLHFLDPTYFVSLILHHPFHPLSYVGATSAAILAGPSITERGEVYLFRAAVPQRGRPCPCNTVSALEACAVSECEALHHSARVYVHCFWVKCICVNIVCMFVLMCVLLQAATF